jgi:hypothetical protein
VAGSFGQRFVEVVWNRERSDAEAEGTRSGLSRRDRPELGDRAATADHDEVLPGLDPVQERLRVPLKLLQTDYAHGRIVAA